MIDRRIKSSGVAWSGLTGDGALREDEPRPDLVGVDEARLGEREREGEG